MGYAVRTFAKDVVDNVADNLERALSAVPKDYLEGDIGNETGSNSGSFVDNESKKLDMETSLRLLKSLYDGVVMTNDALQKTLNRSGVVRFDPTGEAFDPNKHNATFKVSDPTKEPDTVHTCTKVGYMLDDRVVRAAEVGVVQSQ